MKQNFKAAVLMNPAVFTSTAMKEEKVRPVLNWLKNAASLISNTSRRVRQQYYLHAANTAIRLCNN
jgi:hypothetical protein